MHYRSWGVFRVTSNCLASSWGISNPHYSGTTNRGLQYLRGYHPVSQIFPDYFSIVGPWLWCSPNTTFPVGFSLPYSRFTRRYSGNNSCFLFLRLLRCFHSAGSLTVNRYNRPESVKKSHSVIWGSQATCAYPQHFAACHDLLRLPRQGIHHMACAQDDLIPIDSFRPQFWRNFVTNNPKFLGFD